MNYRPRINPWLIFILICIPILIGSIDLTSIVVVLPQATLDLLGPKGLNRANQALWAVTAYLLSYTLSLALVGRLSDVLSRKRVFIACIVIFIIGAVWAGIATDLPLTLISALPIWPDRDVLPLVSLVIGRVIQAIGAGASVSVGMALVSDIFPADKRAEPISLIGALDSLGWVIGNLFAGVMLQILPSWRWLFLINAGIALLALIATVIVLRDVKSEVTTSERYDMRGALVFAVALIALTISLELLNAPTAGAYVLIGISLVFFTLFIFLQKRTHNPLLDMAFVRRPGVARALIVNLLVGFALILVVAGVPLMINLRTVFLRGEGLLTGALRAGIMLCALTVPLVVTVLIGEQRSRRIGAAIPIALGLGLAALGFFSTQLWTYTAPNYVIAFPLALIGAGLGMTIGPLSLVVVDAADEDAQGLASSLVLTMRLLGMTLGTGPAASLTLNWANLWADQAVAPMSETFRNIARPMLIPPKATEALIVVMMIGAAVCLIGMALFYLPLAWRRVREYKLGPAAVFNGLPIALVAVMVVVILGVVDNQFTPVTVSNPIAQQLPPNVEFYAGFNIQQMFLQDTKRPLDAFEKLIGQLTSSSTVSTAGAAQPTTPQNSSPPVADSPTDQLVKLLFKPRQWTDENYVAFCSSPIPANEAEWCFNNGLLSWIGPQAAFALLPRTQAEFDYLFVFQATNRNNAIQFAANLAAALGEAEPQPRGPSLRVLTINVGTPDERWLAITQAYVMVGTPKAVNYTLSHGSTSLADQVEYQRIVTQLPANDFATFYMRSTNFDTDLQPALTTIFPSQAVTSLVRIVSRASNVFFPRNTATPTLLGLSLHVNQQQLTANMVADLPYSLQKLNAAPVTADALAMIPTERVKLWSVANLNIAGIAREVNIDAALEVLLTEGNNAQLSSLFGNTIIRGLINRLGRSIQLLLTHTTGQALIAQLADQQGQPAGMILVLPMVDKDNIRALTVMLALKQQLQFARVLGGLQLDETVAHDGKTSIMTITGEVLQATLPKGLQMALTDDNLLVLTTGGQLADVLTALRQPSSAAITQVRQAWPSEMLDKFLYAYVEPSTSQRQPIILFNGQIRHQTLYVDVVLVP